MMVSGLSNNKDNGGRTGLAEYNSKGEFVASHWLPTDGDLRGAKKEGKFADGYGYDVRVQPRKKYNAYFTPTLVILFMGVL